ncbi:MAG: adenylate/guanylate cyclase domain-containing protein [Terriglobia bacterium]|nr:MAG: adenylate/guanylate cyclase domain-containing protein [Terriglobia bacterium]
MDLAKELRTEVSDILSSRWQSRDGLEVPEPEDIQLGNHAVKLKGTVLYADLRDSTGLVNDYKDFFAAEIYKSYLLVACKIIRSRGGEITAFDGDRVMAVFIGNNKNSAAARTALQLNYAVKKIINPAIKEAYPNSSFQVKQGVGIDSSPLFVARTGIRGSNDLVWVGRAANYAAKLASLDEGSYSSFITEEVYNKLNDTSKYGGQPKRPMWEEIIWEEKGLAIYASTWWWSVT